MKYIKLGLFISVLSLVSACSMIPKPLAVEEGTNLLNFNDIIETSTDEQVGKIVRWGGVIASIKNLKDKTLLEIVHFELRGNARPRITDDSKGRFRLYTADFLDPEIYKKGRAISAVGTFSGFEKGLLGEREMMYPVIDSKKLYLWKEEVDRLDDIHMYHHSWFFPSRVYRPIYRPVIYRPDYKKLKPRVRKSKIQ